MVPAKLHERLKAARKAAGLTQQELADRIHQDQSTIGHWESGKKTKPSPDKVAQIAKVVGVDPEWILYAKGSGPKAMVRSRRRHVLQDVRQLDLRLDYTEVDAIAGAGLGGEAVLENFSPDGQSQVVQEAALGNWRFPAPYAQAELGVTPQHGRIIKVVGDSMAPTLLTGDRVMIDTRDRRPSPGGLFALWDGLGVAVKRLDHIPNSDPPTVKILSDNPAHPAYERTADEINIIGRVVWFARRL